MPNRQLYSREAVLYADLTCSDAGGLDWNDPHSWSDIKFDLRFRPFPLQVAEALSRLGVFYAAGLRLVAEIWGSRCIDRSSSNWETADGLIRATIEGLEAQHLITEAATSEDVQTLTVYGRGRCTISTSKPIKISLADLKEEQDRQFYANV